MLLSTYKKATVFSASLMFVITPALPNSLYSLEEHSTKEIMSSPNIFPGDFFVSLVDFCSAVLWSLLILVCESQSYHTYDGIFVVVAFVFTDNVICEKQSKIKDIKEAVMPSYLWQERQNLSLSNRRLECFFLGITDALLLASR